MKYLITLVAVLITGASIAYAAPTAVYQKTILPVTTNTYDLGSSGDLWANGYFTTLCLSADCRTVWPAGGGSGSFPFSVDSNYGQTVYSTSTPTLWFKSGFFASSTSRFVFASTTALNAVSICLDGDICRTTWPSGSGGTGNVATATTETAGQVGYWSTTGGSPAKLNSVATSSLGVTSPITFSGTLGAQVGGTGGSFGCATCLTGNQTITLSGVVTGGGATAITTAFGTTAVANSVFVNQAGGSAIPTFLATSTFGNTLYGIGTGGQILVESGAGVPTWTASTTFNSPLTFATGAVSCATCVVTSRNLTVAGTANQITSSAGAQDLSADRAWTLSLPNHVIFPLDFLVTNSTTTNATTTTLYFTGLTSGELAVDATGKVYKAATTT